MTTEQLESTFANKVIDFELSTLIDQIKEEGPRAGTQMLAIGSTVSGAILGAIYGDGLSGLFTGAALGLGLGFGGANILYQIYKAVHAAPNALEKLCKKIDESSLSNGLKKIAKFELQALKEQCRWNEHWRDGDDTPAKSTCVLTLLGLAGAGIFGAVSSGGGLLETFTLAAIGGTMSFALVNGAIQLKNAFKSLGNKLQNYSDKREEKREAAKNNNQPQLNMN